MTGEADGIASAVLSEFEQLPAKRKPQTRGNGIREWVPLAGIVARDADGSLKCLSLATGMKCLPQSKLPSANGHILHDWHAEVLAIRAFNHFLLEECMKLLQQDKSRSAYLYRDTGTGESRPFVWREDVTLHMYCSEAPCGDASMELIIAAQEDAAPWEAPLSARMMEKNGLVSAGSAAGAASPDLLLLGRACFSHLGVVRRKPARPDAPPTLSKSCSDKLALKQCTSLLGSLASLLVCPRGVYLSSLVLPESQYSEVACRRCFSPEGRLAAVRGRIWDGEYVLRPFEVQTTALDFAFSRRSSGSVGAVVKYVASNLATAWTANGLAENVIGGVLQGRKQTDPRGGSHLCRKSMWSFARDIAVSAGFPDLVPSRGTYGHMKESGYLAARARVKADVRAEALKDWAENRGDEEHVLDRA